jgi:hypothetical protein
MAALQDDVIIEATACQSLASNAVFSDVTKLALAALHDRARREVRSCVRHRSVP